MAFFYVSGLLLITEHCDNPFGRWYLHTQELLSYDYFKFVHESPVENREVRVINVNHIKCEGLYSGVVQISERHWKWYLTNWLDWFSSETLQWVLWRMQHMLTQVYFLECFEEQNVCRTSIVHQNFPDNPSSYVHLNDHAIIVIRGFQFEILVCESDWHLGHSGRAAGPSLMMVFTDLK
jgi:hypothetical protein